MFKENFNNIYKRELKGSIIKSLIYSLLVSFTVLFIVSFTFWILAIDEYWIGLIIFAILEIGMFSLFFLFFKPSDTKIAKKLDGLGLAERVITMYEYQDKDGLMARIQRENAIEHINKVNLKLLKIVIPTIVIVFTCIAFVLGTASTTVAALSSHDVIQNGKETIEDIIPPTLFQFEVVYEADGEGFIEGEIFQVVYEGENCTGVTAVPENGWAFAGWNDGYEEPFRQDLNIKENYTFVATFIELDEEMQDGDGEEGKPSDEEEQSDLPQDMESSQKDQPSEDPNGEGGGAGGSYDPNNQVIDNETYYGDKTFDNAYKDGMENLQNNSDLSDSSKSVVEDYYKNIEK